MACQRCPLLAAASDVRAAADCALAATAIGRTCWSRTILVNLFGRWKRRHHTKARNSHAGLTKKRTIEIRRTTPPLQKKVRSLERLIPDYWKVEWIKKIKLL
ncbi:hypothetical protein VIGAN_01167200 [Vigna angularis var. angularis]|uniref:Uncharacterized protein n=1 Tax=Vigna angularis var. angularis TaxID=157739 RepID=A0A0S3R0E8_PHAAN|nr:hypothetical protein VIGAN_01167200 [Vigna angularis var. angularis]